MPIEFGRSEAVRLWELMAKYQTPARDTLEVLGVPTVLTDFPYNKEPLGRPEECAKVANFLENMAKLLR